jgi:hypothetical protein
MQTIHDDKPLNPSTPRTARPGRTGGHRFSTRRPSINITPVERGGRVVLGALAAIAGALLLTSAESVVAVILEVLLIGAGLDLVITGALGHCPVYQKLGFTPTSLRRPT